MPEAWQQFDALLRLTNLERGALGLAPLAIESRLARAAQRHAEFLAASGFISHGGSGQSTPGERASAEGYAWSHVGENVLARTLDDIDAAFGQWWHSPGHRDNLLGIDYTETGFGRAYSAHVDCWYYVMLLAKPAC